MIMKENLATYTFLSWLRKGLSNQISNVEGDPNVNLRASVPIDLLVSATNLDGTKQEIKIDNTVQLYGPGDIIGINKNSIVRTEPQNRVTNFEPNYLPYIEFYEEDFPWRYTPYKTDGNKLKPWVTLVVLKTEEFDEGVQLKRNPLPFFRLKNRNTDKIFPIPSELWAWAHVHVNHDLSEGEGSSGNADPQPENTELGDLNPDATYSRVLCPR